MSQGTIQLLICVGAITLMSLGWSWSQAQVAKHTKRDPEREEEEST